MLPQNLLAHRYLEEPMQKRYLSWAEIDQLVTQLADKVGDDYDALLVITRGGMIPACLLSQRRNWRNILVAAVQFYTGIGQTRQTPIFLQFPGDTLISGKRLLVVDDIWDSGKTIAAVKQRLDASNANYEVAVLHYKPTNSQVPGQPDYYIHETAEWIVYPWELHALRDEDEE